MRAKSLLIWLIALTLLIASSTVDAEDEDYQDYVRPSRYQNLFEISFDEETIRFTFFEGDDEIIKIVSRDSTVLAPDRVSIGRDIAFVEDGLQHGNVSYAYTDIAEVLILDEADRTVMQFKTFTGTDTEVTRKHRGNRTSFNRTITVREDKFVRGLLLSVTGDIEVYGEVNKDIVSLFGDIYIGPGAVARGDIATITGRPDVASDASIYGEIYSGNKEYRKRHKFARTPKTFEVSGSFNYNRVDGATPNLWAAFKDHDSLLPSMMAKGGYGFESERWRYEFSVEQTLWRRLPIVVGGAYYRKLASEDDWILDDTENLFFTLIVTEDFKDYYEAEGAHGYLKLLPFRDVKVEIGYRYEETNWLKAQPHLWSLFGGDKLFRSNFSSVERSFRESGIKEIDTTENGSLELSIAWDHWHREDPFDHSGWYVSASSEWSHENFGSDFDYRRHKLSLHRYQSIHRHSMLVVKGMFGTSSGYLPMYKRYFIGGLETMRGYKHKEYFGTEFWTGTLEYAVAFPRTDLAASIFWDVGQIANDVDLSSGIPVKHSVGLGIFIGNDIRLNLSKRLDRSDDDSPQFYARFDHVF